MAKVFLMRGLYWIATCTTIPLSMLGWNILRPDSFGDEDWFFVGLFPLMVELVYPFYSVVGKDPLFPRLSGQAARDWRAISYLAVALLLYAFLFVKEALSFRFLVEIVAEPNATAVLARIGFRWMAAGACLAIYLLAAGLAVRRIAGDAKGINRERHRAKNAK